jgi:hypothetical protein
LGLLLRNENDTNSVSQTVSHKIIIIGEMGGSQGKKNKLQSFLLKEFKESNIFRGKLKELIVSGLSSRRPRVQVPSTPPLNMVD